MPTPQRPPSRRSGSRIILGLGLALSVLVVLLLLAFGGLVFWLRNADLTPLAARAASDALGRAVTIGRLEIRWDDPLGIDIIDLSVANAPWGSQADMIRIGRFAALLDLGALWRGVLRYERLRIADAAIVLERDPNGTGNWKFAGGGDTGFAIVPKDRTQFPTLIDFAGEHGLITYRTRSGNILRIELNEVTIAAPEDTAAVKLQAAGAYNGVAARIDASTESFAALRDADTPFGMKFTLAGKDTDIAFDGTSMEPLDFEGMDGEFALKARSLSDLLAAMQSERRIDLPLSLAGAFARDGDHWSLKGATGRLAKADLAGDLALIEGGPGEADDVALNLDLAPFDAGPILAAAGGDGGLQNWEKTTLHPPALQALKLSADLRTPQLTLGRTRLADFALKARADGGKVTLKELRFAFGGGALVLSGALEGAEKSAALSLDAGLKAAEVAAIAKMLGGQGDEIRGRLDGAATLSMRGATLGEGLRHSQGAMLLILGQGDVARSLVERVSADLRSIFRTQEGRVQAACLLAAMSLTDGIGKLAPLRLESEAAILEGAGTVDLVRKHLDLTIKTERDSTNFFALDLPIRISGPFAELSAAPQLGEDSGLPQDGGALGKLPASLRKMAQGNACAQ